MSVSPQRDSRIDSLGNDERSILILKDILRDFNNDFIRINQELETTVRRVSPPLVGGEIGLSPAPPEITATVQLLSILLNWTLPEPHAHTYEVRRSTHLDWDTAFFVTKTASNTVTLSPLKVGTYYFLVKSVDIEGNYSLDYSFTSVTITAPSAPFVTATVIDNNVLLYWNLTVTSHQIDYYNLYRDGVKFGEQRGTFVPIFETRAGTYTYSVEGVDVAGNAGNWGSVTTAVSTPPDFELEDQRLSNLLGERFNVTRLPVIPSLLACTNESITWEEHFLTRGWNTPNDQLIAGYTIYAQPAEVTGWYEEVIDYLTEIDNTIVTINYQLVEWHPQVDMVISLAYSTDNINFSPLLPGNSQFIPKFRYLKMRLDFTGSNDKALAEFSLIQVTLDVKRELDSGEVVAIATDLNGTEVKFNKKFKDIDSITATADSIEPVNVIYDFTDVPNPVGFSVYALDSTGNRVTYLVTWKARGVV